MALPFVPLRTTAITPADAVLGEPYDLSGQQCCEACLAAIVDFSSSLLPPGPSRATLIRAIGLLREVQSRHACQLCQLVAQAVQDLCPPYASVVFENKDVIRLGLSVPDGEVIIFSRKYIADIKRVQSLLSENTNVSVVPDSSEDSSPSLLLCSCCSTPWRLCRNSSQIELKIVQGWLQECESQHQCRVNDDVTGVNQSKYPSILVDVQGKRLVMPERTEPRYCALSYVYGDSNPFRTTRSTLSNLQRPGALDRPDYLPPATIRDAMTITEGIGERYLWVDSLCIIHDDQEFLEDAIKSMGDFYRQAVLTIASISTSGASDAIPGVLPGSRHHLPWIEFGGTRIFASPVPLHLDVLGSKYESRAWTYQERLLPTRVLYITKNMARFVCLRSERSELERDVDFPSGINLLYMSTEITKTLHTGLETDIYQEKSRWSNYFELVRKYSHRQLTYSSDALAAFMGILETLSPKYRTSFISGMPVSDLLISLHWIPAYDIDTVWDKVAVGRRESFPSWSWAGREGPIEWLEAVILPGWWDWKGVNMNSLQSIRVELKSDTQISLCSQTSSVEWFSAEPTRATAYSEKIRDPGIGLPTPLIKILDGQGRWCGRICHHSPGVITGANTDKMKFILLSTCIARKSYICDDPESFDWRYTFDHTVFPTMKKGEVLARLCNVLLVQVVGNGYAERLALCQVHSDVWETMEKEELELILI